MIADLPHDHRGADQNQHDADRDRALERESRADPAWLFRLAVASSTAATLRRGASGKPAPNSGRPPRATPDRNTALPDRRRGSRARLEPIELRRGRGHVGVSLARRAVGLGRGAAESSASAAMSRSRACPAAAASAALNVGAAARRACPFTGRRQRRLLRRQLRRTGPRRRQIGPQIARRALLVAVTRRRTALARGGGAAGRGRGGFAAARRIPAGARGAAEGVAAARSPGAAGREASRARWAASNSTLRTASSSDSRSRVISDSLSGGCTLRSCAISAERPAHRAHGGSRREHWGPVRQWRGDQR